MPTHCHDVALVAKRLGTETIFKKSWNGGRPKISERPGLNGTRNLPSPNAAAELRNNHPLLLIPSCRENDSLSRKCLRDHVCHYANV